MIWATSVDFFLKTSSPSISSSVYFFRRLLLPPSTSSSVYFFLGRLLLPPDRPPALGPPARTPARFRAARPFKNFQFDQFFGLKRAIFMSGFTSAENYRFIWILFRNIQHDLLYSEIKSNLNLNGWTPFKIHIFILKVTDLSQTSFFQICSNTVLL